MYEAFFGLTARPFEPVPDPRFLFLGERQREALGNLRYGLTAPRGLTLLVGEAGTGKTTLLEAILSEVDQEHIECVLLSNPTLSRAEFYEFLADEFRLNHQSSSSKTRFLFEFRQHLLARSARGQISALVLDEAQSLPPELLEEVRLLSNIETQTVKLLNVVLSGQPELSARLNDPALRHLKQRISLRCELRPFDLSETAAYIAGRVRIAGGDPGKIFSREAVLAIHDASGGVPRTINMLCENALVGAFAAQTKPVLRALVEEICRDFDVPVTAVPQAPTGDSEAAQSGESAAGPHVEDGPGSDAPVLFAAVTGKRRFVFF